MEGPVAPVCRRKMTLLDAILLVGSTAIGLGAFQFVRRAWFQGWIWLADRGPPDTHTCVDRAVSKARPTIPSGVAESPASRRRGAGSVTRRPWADNAPHPTAGAEGSRRLGASDRSTPTSGSLSGSV